jgi:hypothetical protein
MYEYRFVGLYPHRVSGKTVYFLVMERMGCRRKARSVFANQEDAFAYGARLASRYARMYRNF